jgi:HAMP domain-containing protein
MTGRSTVKLASTLFVAVLMLAAGCSRSSDVSVSSPTGKTSGAPEPLTFVALGDSWPEGDHCGYCETFAGRYADGLEALVGGPVDFLDYTGHAQPGLEVHGGGGTASLLRALRENASFRDQVASGDVIMIATGPNDGDRAFGPYAEGQCGEGFACVQRLEEFWRRNFGAILDEIGRVRGDRPTAIRLVSAANFFVSDPNATKGLPPDAMEFGAAFFEALNTAECDAARTHDAICVDVRPVLNGPTLDQPVDENSPESMQAVADALLATGLPELGR